MFAASSIAEPASAVPKSQTGSPETGSLFIGLGAAIGIITLVAIIAGVTVVCRTKHRP